MGFEAFRRAENIHYGLALASQERMRFGGKKEGRKEEGESDEGELRSTMFAVSLLLREVIVVMRENNRVTSQHNTTRLKIPRHVPNGVRVDRRKEGRKEGAVH